MRDFNVPALWNISIHEVYPGHFLHYQHLRQVDSKVRKSIFFAPATCVEGWAHYCEEMMLEAGFGRKDPLVSTRFMRHVEQALPAARHVELDCGHLPQIEQPRQTHAAIEKFLQTLAA